MGTDVHVRPYEARDRAAVRQICADTADAGQPVESFFPDREVFADLLTNYYTQFEPQSTFIADNDGEVVGYLTGCLDTKRFLSTMKWRIVPVSFRQSVIARYAVASADRASSARQSRAVAEKWASDRPDA